MPFVMQPLVASHRVYGWVVVHLMIATRGLPSHVNITNSKYNNDSQGFVSLLGFFFAMQRQNNSLHLEFY